VEDLPRVDGVSPGIGADTDIGAVKSIVQCSVA